MDSNKLQELYRLYFDFIPLFLLSKTAYRERDGLGNLCNKNQNLAIMVIGKAGTITPTTLSKFIDLEKGSLTTLVDSLEGMGLAFRSSDPNDRRKTLISLTSRGFEQMRMIEEQSQKRLELMFGKLDENEIDEMHTSLKTLIKIFKKIV